MTLLTSIKIISLEESVQRRAEFTQHASDCDMDWSFFAAYKAVVSPLEYNVQAAKRGLGRALSQSEIGCYVSHFKCWEWLANSGYDQTLILEDDVIVDWKAIKNLSECNLAAYGINYLRLFSTHPVNCKIIKYRFLSPHYHLIRIKGWSFGTQGYILTKSAARFLVENYVKITFPVDWVLMRYWEHKLVNYSVFPFPVIERHVRINYWRAPISFGKSKPF